MSQGRKMSKLVKTRRNRPNLRQVLQTFEKSHKPETKFCTIVHTLTKIFSKLRQNLLKIIVK